MCFLIYFCKKSKENPKNNVVEICVDNKITEVDYEQITTQLKADLQKHGKLHILEEVCPNYSMDSIMLLKDILFGLSLSITLPMLP